MRTLLRTILATMVLIGAMAGGAIGASAATTTIDDSTTGTGANQFNYVGAHWSSCACDPSAYQKTNHWDDAVGDYVTFSLTGTKFSFYAIKDSLHGISAVSIDGAAETMIDLYSPSRGVSMLVWTSPTLAAGTHTFRARVTGRKNPASTGTYITVDRADVAQAIASTPTRTPVATNTPASTTTLAQKATPAASSSAASSSAASSPAATKTANQAQRATPAASNPPPTKTATLAPVKSPTAASTQAAGGTVTSVDDLVTGTGLNQFDYIGPNWASCGNCDSGTYDGSNSWDNTAGDYVTLSFSGTLVQYYAVKDTIHGIAGVSVDGGPETLVDLYAPARQGNQLMWTSKVLAAGTHTLKIRVTGTKNANSDNTNVTVDRAAVTGSGVSSSSSSPTPSTSPTVAASPTKTATLAPVKSPTAASTQAAGGTVTSVDDLVTGTGLNQFDYIGPNWASCGNCDSNTYDGSNSWDNTAGDYVTLSFSGTLVQYYAVKDTIHGIAGVSVDGGPETLVDLYAPARQGNQLMWTSKVLAAGTHTLKIRVTGTKNANSDNTNVTVDRAAVTGSGGSSSSSSPTPSTSPTVAATPAATPGGKSYLSLSGNRFMYKGQPVVLRGMVFNNPGVLTCCGGPNIKNAYNFSNETEFQWIGNAGANSVRFGLDTADYFRDPTTFWSVMDQYVGWAKAHHVWLIPTVFQVGDEGLDPQHGDFNWGNFFSNTGAENAMVNFWAAMAAHYANEPAIGGYDIMNEPDINGAPTPSQSIDINTYTAFAQRVVNAIQAADSNHVVIVQATNWSVPNGISGRVAFEAHAYGDTFYPGNYQNDRPLWMGEFGVSWNASPDTSGSYAQQAISKMEADGHGWSFFVLRNDSLYGMFSGGAGSLSTQFSGPYNVFMSKVAGSVQPNFSS